MFTVLDVKALGAVFWHSASFLPPRIRLCSEGMAIMGQLTYGDAGVVILFEDRTLRHVQLAIGPKLRRREGFFFSWIDDLEFGGGGRSSLWLDHSIPLLFTFGSDYGQKINPEWIEALSRSASSAAGMQLVAEPGPATRRR
jgi:hypothetical protein